MQTKIYIKKQMQAKRHTTENNGNKAYKWRIIDEQDCVYIILSCGI